MAKKITHRSNRRGARPRARKAIPLSEEQRLLYDSTRAANLIMNLASDLHLEEHPDALLRSVFCLLDDLGWTLCRHLMKNDWPLEDRVECESKLRRILRACRSAGARIGPGPGHRMPSPDTIAWCAQAVRARINFELQNPHACGFDHCPLMVASFSGDATSIAAAFQRAWPSVTGRPCPATGAPLESAILDLIFQMDDRWAVLDASEKAKRMVLACLKAGKIPRPAEIFGGERKAKKRRQQRTNAVTVRPVGGQGSAEA